MTIKLTKDADALFSLLYKEYCQKRNDGVSKSSAKMFGGAISIQETITPRWTLEDTNETCNELSRAGFLNCFYGDNIVQHCHISDNGIIYMENRFKDGLKSILDYLGKLGNILPI